MTRKILVRAITAFSILIGAVVLFLGWRIAVLTSDDEMVWFMRQRRALVADTGAKSNGRLYLEWKGRCIVVARGSPKQAESSTSDVFLCHDWPPEGLRMPNRELAATAHSARFIADDGTPLEARWK